MNTRNLAVAAVVLALFSACRESGNGNNNPGQEAVHHEGGRAEKTTAP